VETRHVLDATARLAALAAELAHSQECAEREFAESAE
jgi:hypothetical protein